MAAGAALVFWSLVMIIIPAFIAAYVARRVRYAKHEDWRVRPRRFERRDGGGISEAPRSGSANSGTYEPADPRTVLLPVFEHRRRSRRPHGHGLRQVGSHRV